MSIANITSGNHCEKKLFPPPCVGGFVLLIGVADSKHSFNQGVCLASSMFTLSSNINITLTKSKTLKAHS